MGCDIHLHLEYRHPSWGIEPIIANFFSVDRDYRLFATLADVRNYEEIPVLFPPRGLPEDLSQYVHEQFYAKIVPNDAEDWQKNVMHEWCYETDARHYVEKHDAHIKAYGDGSRWVSNPDWHNASHLTRGEIVSACKHSSYNLSGSPEEMQMVLDFMQSVDARFGADSSRTVFWFDN